MTHICGTRERWVNSMRPRQNRRHFEDDVFKCNLLNENVWIPIKISLQFVSKVPINNIPTSVQILATSHYLNQWWPSSTTHICVTRPHWVKGIMPHAQFPLGSYGSHTIVCIRKVVLPLSLFFTWVILHLLHNDFKNVFCLLVSKAGGLQQELAR